MKEKRMESAYTEAIANCRLFNNIPKEKLDELISFLHGHIRSYQKGETIVQLGDPFSYAGIVLEGKVEVSYTNNHYDKFNVNHFAPSEIFGEALALKRISYSPIQVQSLSDSRILFVDLSYVLVSEERCCDACGFLHQLLLNLTSRMADQNVFSNLKLRILSQKSLRDRIFVYLGSIQPDEQGVRHVPFSQTALAEFLCVNRSALSRELGRMQDENLLLIRGSEYTLLSQ